MNNKFKLNENSTGKRYSFLWSKCYAQEAPEKYHFDYIQDIIPDKIVRGSIGIDIGCGSGWDIFSMAKNNPLVKIIGLDISDGVYSARKLCVNLPNVSIIRGSAEQIPLKREVCDFVYSFGVLHHLVDYKKGFSEAVRILKQDSPYLLYLYENHADNSIKYVCIKIVSFIRKITVKVPPVLLYFFSRLASPFLVIFFSYPAGIFKRFKSTRRLYENMPFNFGSGFLSLTGDIYDRLATPVEHRFSRQDILDIFGQYGFCSINITKLKNIAGWVVWGYKR